VHRRQESDIASIGLASRQPSGSSRRLTRLLRHGDRPFTAVTLAGAVALLALVAAIGIALWQNSALSRDKFGLEFIWTSTWDPALEQAFGALPFIVGTLVTSALALVLAVPVAVGAAVFLAELAPRSISGPVGTLIELLAAVPSVVYGLWGLFALIPVLVKPIGGALAGTLGFIPIFAGPMFGPSRLAAGLLLAIMILPTITVLTRDVFRAIPATQREGALALGATRWEVIRQVLIPYGLSGILGAIILGLARALGETIAVTMVIGNNLDLTASLLHPGYTMASIIANEFTEATYDLYLQALIEIGLVLFAMTLVINFVAQLLIWRVTRRAQAEARA
jgi:phosphate transport system permease protein